jgi:hypothetical protein
MSGTCFLMSGVPNLGGEFSLGEGDLEEESKEGGDPKIGTQPHLAHVAHLGGG